MHRPAGTDRRSQTSAIQSAGSGSLEAMAAPDVAIRQVAAANLTAAETSTIRELLRAAFEDDADGFTDDDWDHASGRHAFPPRGRRCVLAYASVALRDLQADSRPIRAGYVEAVATRRDVQGHGHGTTVMRAVNEHIRGTFELGALSTGIPDFYQRLGWELLAGIDGREDGARPAADSRRRRGDHGAADAHDPASGSARHDQLRMAPRGRLVTR